MKINWTVKEKTTKQEMVSSDNRWHISQMPDDCVVGKFYLSNYDLLLSPYGSGSDYKTCFESFIDRCDANIENIRRIQREAIEYLEQLKQLDDSAEVTPLNGEEQN